MMKNVRSSNNGIMAPLYRRSSTLAGALLLSIGLHVALGFSTRPAAQQSSSLAPLKAATALPLDTIVPPTPLEAEESKVGVLLLNLGGPETSDDVEGGSFSLLSYLFLLARLFLLQRKKSNIQSSHSLLYPSSPSLRLLVQSLCRPRHYSSSRTSCTTSVCHCIIHLQTPCSKITRRLRIHWWRLTYSKVFQCTSHSPS